MPTIYIDGTEYEAKEGDNILQACLGLDIDLPYFCWHPAMGSIGACRQCAVVQFQNEEDTRGRIVMGCMTPVTEGARFSLAGDKARGFREDIIESLMLNHPHDCPVCAEGGECHLQDMTVMVGHRDREYRGRKNTHRNQDLGPLIHHEMNRCITCYRCTRFYRDYAGGDDLAAMASHDHVYFGRHEEGTLESEFAGNLVEVCPTGVFTDRGLVNEYTRKWDLQSAPSVCTSCGVGCNTMPGERYGKLKRIHNRYNSEVNGYFLCDRGRFGGRFVNSDNRIPAVGRRDEQGRFSATDAQQAIGEIAALVGADNVVGIGSPRASIEANFALRELVGAEAYCAGMSTAESKLVRRILCAQAANPAANPSIKTMESADAVLILGEDLTNTAPRVALALRQTVRNKAYEMAAELHLQHWQDAAIRNLAQDQKSPLYIASVAATKLDDVATQTCHLSPDDIAALGFAIAAKLGGSPVSSDQLPENLAELATAIAADLATAKMPLVISGTGCGSAAVVDAAASISAALAKSGSPVQLSMCVPECNSLGVALLESDNALTLDAVIDRADRGEIDTLLVLENDLYRRASRDRIDTLISGARKVVVLDTLDNDSCTAADLVLPTASFAESEGTLISMEGRAQRHYPVFQPGGARKPAWEWLRLFGRASGHQGMAAWSDFDAISRACTVAVPRLQGICEASPPAGYRSLGQKIPRQPHRYSGRTAMRANVSVHEPKQAVDGDSPLAFTMEGHSGDQPGALLPYVWAPGWNSNQSLHKFQSSAGGPLRGGTAGQRLIDGESGFPDAESGDGQAPLAEGQYRLVAMYRIFGSDEQSVHAEGIADLCRPASIEITRAAASALGVGDGDGLTVQGGACGVDLLVAINDTLAAGCVGFSSGVTGTAGLTAGEAVNLSRAENWQRPPQLIGTDRGTGT